VPSTGSTGSVPSPGSGTLKGGFRVSGTRSGTLHSRSLELGARRRPGLNARGGRSAASSGVLDTRTGALSSRVPGGSCLTCRAEVGGSSGVLGLEQGFHRDRADG
jgi:hypothetical protein